MAQGIISCTGERFNIGDKVKTPDGNVIRITGAAIGQKFYNAELCVKVHDSTPLSGDMMAAVSTGVKVPVTDCVVWGN